MLVPQRTGIGSTTGMLVRALSDTSREIWLYWRHRRGLDFETLPEHIHTRAIKAPVAYMTVSVPALLLIDGISACHFPAGALPAYCPARTIVTGHDLTWHRLEHVFVPERAAQLRDCFEPGLLKADHIIAVSQNTRNDIMDVYGIQPDRLSVVPHGVDPRMKPASGNTVGALRDRYKLERPFLLYTGAFHEHKNVDWLLQCYARAFAGRQDRPELVLTGPPVPRSEEILALANSLGIGDWVRYLGYLPRSEMPALMSAATAFVFPSLYEGFGLPPLEAMSCGTPVVSSTGGALKETVGEAAVLVDPTDDDMLISALRRIVEDENLRSDLAARGHKQAKLFTWERTAELTWQVYERVLEG